MRRRKGARVLGPYPAGNGFRLVLVDEEGGRSDRGAATEEEAKALKRVIEERLCKLKGTTLDQALTNYETYLRDDRGNKGKTIAETMRRLRLMFPNRDRLVSTMRADEAEAAYEKFRRGRSVDYHRNTLAEAKTFWRWAVADELIGTSPMESIKGRGKRKTGKPQLTGDEARRLYGWLLWRARRGDDAALACLMLLTMALRQGDVVDRVVRDVDLDATVLRVSGGKTAKSNRPRAVPSQLQPLLRKRAEGRVGLAPLFPTPKGLHHTRSWLRAALKRFCRDAGVPYACPHALKGTAGTVLAQAGEAAEVIAEHLSHEQASTTTRHYVSPGALDDAATARGLVAIQGGRR